MCNVSRFSGLKLLVFLLHSSEYLDNTIKGFPLCDVGRVTYVVLVSGYTGLVIQIPYSNYCTSIKGYMEI